MASISHGYNNFFFNCKKEQISGTREINFPLKLAKLEKRQSDRVHGKEDVFQYMIGWKKVSIFHSNIKKENGLHRMNNTGETVRLG